MLKVINYHCEHRKSSQTVDLGSVINAPIVQYHSPTQIDERGAGLPAVNSVWRISGVIGYPARSPINRPLRGSPARPSCSCFGCSPPLTAERPDT